MTSASAKHAPTSCSFAGPPGSTALLFAGLDGSEGLSQLFEYTVKALSPEGELKADDWLGQPLVVELPYDFQAPARVLHAHICGFRRVADQGQLPCYEFLLRPWLWFATCASNSRIFQSKSVPEVLKEVLSVYPGNLDCVPLEQYPALEYCVQFGESDFAFVSRLMEEAGLYYFFRHTAEGHCLVITDSMSEHTLLEGDHRFELGGGQPELFNRFSAWVPEQVLCSGRVRATDFDFTKANTREASVLSADASVVMAHDQATYEHYHYPGHFNDVTAGEAATKVRVQALNAEQQRIRAAGCAPYLLPGACFTLEGRPEHNQNTHYLIVQAQLQATCVTSTYGVSGPRFSCQVVAIRSDGCYRAELKTPRPKIVGPQTAFVVGKEGEPLWVDEFGRIKVQFHWDRSDQRNENCSCWVRVAQPLAGQRWGAVFLPRVGQEVVVEFLDGNPDRPLVTGSLYNGGMRPPYALPAQVARSGIKSQSLGAEDVYNELRFEDKGGAEQLLFHAGRNQDITVRNDAFEHIGNDIHLKVGGNAYRQVMKDAHEHIDGDLNARVSADYSLDVGGDQACAINGSCSLEVGADQQVKLGGAHSLDIGADSDTKVGGKFKLGASSVDVKGSQTITLEAGQTLVLKAGSSTVELGPKGVSINGAMVAIDGKGKVDINGGGEGSSASAEAPSPKQPQKPKKTKAPKEADDGRD